MTRNAQHLADLLGSRICHDLISPLGAIGNGVELIGLSGGAMTPEMQLISDSADAATARVRQLRLAFGHATRDQQIAAREMTGILARMSDHGRVAIEWAHPVDLFRREAKTIVLALMCLEQAMPRGGQITINQTDGIWSITARADSLKSSGPEWEVLASDTRDFGDTDDMLAAKVEFALLPQAVAAAGRQLSVACSEGQIDLSF